MNLSRRMVLGATGLVVVAGTQAFFRRRWHVSFGVWNTTMEDIAEAQVVTQEGKPLFETDNLKPPVPGWEYGGTGMFLSQFPDVVLVSWRKPSAKETPAQRCHRRMELDCGNAGGESFPFMYKDGSLTGPVRVSLINRIPEAVWRQFGRDETCSWEFGLGLGSAEIAVRWVLKGLLKQGAQSGTRFGYLAHGGDWGDLVPPSLEIRRTLKSDD